MFLAFASEWSMYADTPSSVPTIIKKKPKDDPNNEGETGRSGNRSPSFSIPCTISIDNGIECDMINDDIISFEIWDEEEICCYGSYLNEEDFVMHLFSFTGDYLIKLETLDYYYYGYVSIY